MTKCKRNKAITGSRTWADPTKERHRQNGGLILDVVPAGRRPGHLIKRYRAVWECPLDACYDNGFINREEYRAGRRFHRAYYGIVLLRRRNFRPTCEAHALWKETAVEKLLKLARKIIAPEDLNAVVEICGHSQPARNPRALVCLKRGLSDLASQWHLAANDVCKPKSRDY